ncbi:class I SAM-dependent methyltransferase [soil metagenome]
MMGSIAFDRAADYYDATRGLSDDGALQMTDALSGVFAGARRPVLEVGVGTGQIAVPLRQRGIPVAGIDLSRAMLMKLLEKSREGPTIQLVEGDATAMPFPDDTFDGAYLRWVLHLIADWRAAVREIARVTRSGGSFLAALGSQGGVRAEIQSRFAEITGISTEPAGLSWSGWEDLDDEVDTLGGTKLPDVVLHDRERDTLETFVSGIEANMYSWTWAVENPELRGQASAEVRRWAEERLGSLDAVPREPFEWRFAAYRMA